MNGYFIFSAIILFGGIQGLLLVIALLRLRDANRSANLILSGFVLLISLVLFSRLVYVGNVEIWKTYPHLFLLPDIPMFLYGPLFFLYIQRLLNGRLPEGWLLWRHFIPAMVHLSILMFYLSESRSEYLNRLMTADLIELPYAVWASILHIACYLGCSFFIFRENLRKAPGQQRFKFGKNYLYTFFILASICWLSWFYAILSENFPIIPKIAIFNYNIAWVALSFTSFILAYFAMSKSEVFKNDLSESRYKGSSLTAQTLDLFEKNLTKLMLVEKPFLDAQLTQSQLAQQLGMSPKDLSRLINERFGLRFFDFVNRYRVDEFKRLLAVPKNQQFTLLALAFEAGFNSKTTFNAAFKYWTGMTPAAFKKNMNTSK